MAMNSKVKQSKRESLALRDGPSCWICGARGAAQSFTLDHVIPRSAGGPNALSNLRLACYCCNYKRHH